MDDTASLCKWEELTTSKVNITSELVKLKFIAGTHDNHIKLKFLEKLQVTPHARTEDLIDFCQMASQLSDFASGENKNNNRNADTFYLLKNKKQDMKKCSRCGQFHKMRECPAYGKRCRYAGGAIKKSLHEVLLSKDTHSK